MATSLVMTIIGPDRPGLVGKLSAVIADHGGNWLESRMAHLGGQFAGILRIEVSEERQRELLAALDALKADGLKVQSHPASTRPKPVSRTLTRVQVVGHDRPGIVRQISQVLAQHGVNVEELETHCESAPMSGEQHFHATAAVQLPATCTLAQLQAALETIATDLMVDITVLPESGT